MPAMVLDLGCGARKLPGAIGLDRAMLPGVDVLSGVEALPLRTDSADTIYLRHVLEHVGSLVDTLEEVWRVGRPGAEVHVWAPHFSSGLYTWGDPTHRRAIATTTMDYFDAAAPFGYYSRARFRIVERRLHFGLSSGPSGSPTGTDGPSGPLSAVKAAVGSVVDAVANAGRVAQLLCERVWGPWIGFEEVYFRMQVVKRPRE